MKNNIPLNDDDREAWLDQINNKLNKLKNKNVVIACFFASLAWFKAQGVWVKVWWLRSWWLRCRFGAGFGAGAAGFGAGFGAGAGGRMW